MMVISCNLFACDFDCTVNKHMQSIKNQDYKTFETTISKNSPLTFILPDGKYYSDPIEYREVLKGWFSKGDTWSVDYKIISSVSTAKMGHVLLLMDYNETDKQGNKTHLDHFLNLIFKLEDKQWQLIHDQNTITSLDKMH